MRSTMLLSLWIGALLASAGAHGREPREPRGCDVEDASWGLCFAAPAGWTRQSAPAGYLFVAPDQRGFFAVLPHETRTLDALRAEAVAGIADGAGTRLALQGDVAPFGANGLSGAFSGWIEGSPARARVIGLLAPHGRGATILVAAAPERYTGELDRVAVEIAESVVWTEVATRAATPSEAAATSGAEEEEWQQFLQGCRLSSFERYSSGSDGSGYMDTTVVDLCSGYFTFRDQSQTVFNATDPVSGNVAFLHSAERGDGQWSVVRHAGESVLRLQLHDGSVRNHVLGWQDGKTLVDGRRWLRTCNPNDSMVEARPACR